jgi:hypothetical protein
VEVVLSIMVEVDDEYSGAQHADDIVLTAKRTFSSARVKLLDIGIGTQSDPQLSDPAS